MLTALAAGLLPAGAGTAAPGQPRPDVTVSVTGLRSEKGMVLACMSPDPKRFPRCQGDPGAYREVVPAKAEVRLTFRGVAPGTYAIALLHDENGNGKADRALGMMPTEGFGFSRDAAVHMGPPSFAAAAVAIEGEPAHFRIRMRYLL